MSEPDHGIYHAMNKGWDLSQGEFIYYLGADDELLSLPLQAFHDAIRDNIDIVFGDVILGNGRYFRSQFGFSLRFDNTLHHQGLFLRRSLFQTAPSTPSSECFLILILINDCTSKESVRCPPICQPHASA